MKRVIHSVDEDWIKRRSWDLPTTLVGLQQVVGPDAGAMLAFLQLDAAQAMPRSLFDEIMGWLDWTQANVPAITEPLRRRLELAARASTSTTKSLQTKTVPKHLEAYDPDAQDGDGDGIVQDGTPWERPAGTRIVDEAGRELARGLSQDARPAQIRIVDANDQPVSYTPKGPPETGSPNTGIPTKPESTIAGQQPKLQSLKDQGLASVDQIVHPQPATPAKTPELAEVATPGEVLTAPTAPGQPARQSLTGRLRDRAIRKDRQPVPPSQIDPQAPGLRAGNQMREALTGWLRRRREEGQQPGWANREFLTVDGQRVLIRREMNGDAEQAKLLIAHDLGVRLAEEHDTDELLAFLAKHGKPVNPDGIPGDERDVSGRVPPTVIVLRVANGLQPAQDIYEPGGPTPAVVISPDDPEYHNLVAEKVAGVLVKQWAATSNDAPLSLAMQHVAGELFDIEDETYEWDIPASDLRDMNWVLERDRPILESFVRIQYGNTQQFFAEQGITHVRLYRGMKISESDDHAETAFWQQMMAGGERSEDAEVVLRPLSSFAWDVEQAAPFQGGDETTEHAVMMRGVVPVERIFSTTATGNGCWGEAEMVVVGGPNKFNISYRPPTDSQEDEMYAEFNEVVDFVAGNMSARMDDRFRIESDFYGDGWSIHLIDEITGRRFDVGNALADEGGYDSETVATVLANFEEEVDWRGLDAVRDGVAAVQGDLPGGWELRLLEAGQPALQLVDANGGIRSNPMPITKLFSDSDLSRPNMLEVNEVVASAINKELGDQVGIWAVDNGMFHRDPYAVIKDEAGPHRFGRPVVFKSKVPVSDTADGPAVGFQMMWLDEKMQVRVYARRVDVQTVPGRFDELDQREWMDRIGTVELDDVFENAQNLEAASKRIIELLATAKEERGL